MPETEDEYRRLSADDVERECELSLDSCGLSSGSQQSGCDCEKEIQRLRDELCQAKSELLLQTKKCHELLQLQTVLDGEIHELTGSLFQEAYNRVNLASEQQEKTEKLLKEANGKIEVLQAEVNALKTLVLATSVRSNTPQARIKTDAKAISSGHRRIRSDVARSTCDQQASTGSASDAAFQLQQKQIDPSQKLALEVWRQSSHDKQNAFWKLVHNDLLNCLEFAEETLSAKIMHAAEENTVVIEPLAEDLHQRCDLSSEVGICKYRIKLEETDNWYCVTQLCRNRIAAVCDLLTYLRYMKQGLVKSSDEDVYWQIARLRNNLARARFGFADTPFS